MIRKYKSEDADAVVLMWRISSDLAHPFLTKEFLDKEADNIRNVHLAMAETWVTEINGNVVGFIALVGEEIGGLFLDPRYHGRGLGRALVDKAVAEKGALKVEVFKENVIGRRFYNSYGFRSTEEFFHEASGQMTLRMVFAPE